MDSLFHWLAQPYHTPDHLHTNGAILGYLTVVMVLMWACGYIVGQS